MNRKSVVDHYAVLGVPQTATEAEIKKAFRKKSLKVHPDKNPSKDAAALFIKLKAAYDFLSDNSKVKINKKMLQDFTIIILSVFNMTTKRSRKNATARVMRNFLRNIITCLKNQRTKLEKTTKNGMH